MYLLRNAHDPRPTGMSRAAIRAHAERVRTSLGIKPRTGVMKAFTRLGGRYERVSDTFGRYTDRVVIRSSDDFTYEDWHAPELATFGLAECLGVLFLHHPLVMRDHGPAAATVVRRSASPATGIR